MELYLGSFTTLRRWQRSTSWAFKAIRQVSQTGLLRAGCLLSDPQRERGDYVVKLDVGSRFSPRATVHVSYNSDADCKCEVRFVCWEYVCTRASTETRRVHYSGGYASRTQVSRARSRVLRLPRCDVSKRDERCTSVYKDCHSTGAECADACAVIAENDVVWISNKLTWFLREYFRDHLESLPFFHKWFVTLPSKLQQRSGPGMPSASGAGSSSSSTIIRIVVLFSGEMDLYQVMQSLRLPSSMQFDHMLQRFSLRVLCSHSLEEILTSKRLEFGSQWSCRAQLDARLNKQAWAQILSQLAKKLEVDAEQEADERAFLAEEKERKQQQAELQHLQHSQQQQLQQQQASRKPQAHSSGEDHHLGSEADTEVTQRDELHGVRVWLARIAAVLGCSQEVSATVSFVSVSDALLGNRWVASLLSPKLLRHIKHMVLTPGGVASEWKSGCDSFRAEFRSTQYAQGNGSSRTAGNSLSRASSRSSAQLADDFSSLEHSIGAAFPFATPLSTAESHKRPLQTSGALPSERPEIGMGDAKDAPTNEKKRELKAEEAQENELLEFYDMCAKHLLGVSVVRAEAGTSGLTCVLEGWNVFSLLPRLQAQLGRMKSVVRTKSSASTTSNSGSAASGRPR